MNRSERLGQLTNMVVEKGSVTITQIVEELGVSGATARRDLDALAQQQLITRTRGGARSNTATGDLPLRYRTSRQSDEKTRLAAAAVDMITPGTTIALNGGTTMTEVALELGIRSDQDPRFSREPVTVVTNAINIANDLTVRKNIRVVCTGGVARTRSYELVGVLASLILPRINIDITFFGFDAMDPAEGFFTHNAEEAAINQAMIIRAKYVVAVGDHTKLRQTAFAKICDYSKINELLTGSGAEMDDQAQVKAHNILVTVVSDTDKEQK